MNTRISTPRRLLTGAAACLLFVLVTACENSVEPPTPQPGSALVSLAQVASDDGGLSFTITGTGIMGARAAASGYAIYWRLVSSQELRVIVMGRLAAGPLVSIDVADLNQLADFRATVVEVTDQRGAPREQLAAYRVSVEAPALR